MTNILTENEIIPKFATKTKRFFAILIDYIIYFVIFYFIGKYYGENYVTEDGVVGFRLEGFPALVCFLCWFLLIPILEGATGQTIGKMIFRIKTLKHNGTKISIGKSIGKSIVRHLFDFVDCLPFFGIVGLLVASNNELRQRVGDLVAKTIVLEK